MFKHLRKYAKDADDGFVKILESSPSLLSPFEEEISIIRTFNREVKMVTRQATTNIEVVYTVLNGNGRTEKDGRVSFTMDELVEVLRLLKPLTRG